jgi:single-stranded-DNA-specific exonuclease
MTPHSDSATAETESASDERPYLGVASSTTGRLWIDRATAHEVDAAGLRQLTQALSLMPGMEAAHAEPLARAMAGRGIGPEHLTDYLNPTLKAQFPDPSSFIDMDRLIEVLIDALIARKNIYVFADYDVDGATSGLAGSVVPRHGA